MSKESDEGMGALRKFFPERAYHLSEYLRKANAEKNILEDWREAQIVKFIASLILNTDELVGGFVQERISRLAWAARNLLELSVWIEYCNLSVGHAKQFRDDSARDLIGFSKAIQSIHTDFHGAPAQDLDSAMNRLIVFAENTFNVSDLNDDFKRVRCGSGTRKTTEIFGTEQIIF